VVVAGDVFDTMQPSAAAQERLFRFLAQLAQTRVRQVVLVAGNHDSPSRLMAPAAVLETLGVHVVGHIEADPSSWRDCMVPLVGASGEVEAVCLAVPYVHEFRLGVRATDLDVASARAAYRERFAAVYEQLADWAQEAFPGVPLMATGHLTLGAESTRDDYPHEIHQVGTLQGLPPGVFDGRIVYGALGHIHRCYPVDPQRRLWYSGSPVAFSLPEAKTPRQVMVVDLAEEAVVQRVPVPSWRDLLAVEGAPDAVLEQLKTLTTDKPLAPLVFLRVVADVLPGGWMQQVHEALQVHDDDARPRVVELRQIRPAASASAHEPTVALDDLEPHQVFEALLSARGIDEGEALIAAFSSLQSATPEAFDAMVQAVAHEEVGA